MNDDYGPGLDTPPEPAAAEVERLLWVRSLLGPDFPVPPTATLVRRMREVRYQRGDMLYRDGSAADRIFFIVSGRVTLTSRTRAAREFGARDVLGFLDALQDRPHAYDANVREETLVLELEFEDWQEFIEDNFEFLQGVVTRFSQNLDPASVDNRPRVPVQRLSSAKNANLALSFVERIAVLRSAPPLEKASIQALARLAGLAEVRFLSEAREPLIGSGIFIVESGKVRAFSTVESGKTWVEELEEGGVVAGLGLLQRGHVDVEVEALQPSSLYFLPSEVVFDVMEDHFNLAQSMLSFVARSAETQAFLQSQVEVLKTPWPVPTDAV